LVVGDEIDGMLDRIGARVGEVAPLVEEQDRCRRHGCNVTPAPD
jgi:hypothetical protein